GALQGWSGFLEFDYVAELLLDDYNNADGSSPGRNIYPVVADPDGEDLNQLYLNYSNGKHFSARLGRQRILLDNQRFVGGVGWRQNEQTYDGLTLTMSGVMNATVRYSYVSRVKRIFGERSPAGSHDADIHLLNVAVPINKSWAATPYLYAIDNDDAAQFSSMTIGARINGELTVGDRPLTLGVDFATQTDAADAPVDYRAGYFRLDAGLKVSDVLHLGLGYEVLGGDSNEAGKAFRTPLATLHAFQGWADQFLNTPDAGIADSFASVRYSYDAWSLTGVWHRFQADSGSADYGSELDMSLGRRFAGRYDLLVKAALFDADDPPFVDTSKFWLMLQAGF
ncbi:MAG: alginate export family protein, partial [Halioglobus sp.]|nr:alginate export family protein [Halioglobus sp.]